MGILWGLFMGKPVDKLKELKDKNLAKIKKLQEENKAIDKAIAEKTNEQ